MVANFRPPIEHQGLNARGAAGDGRGNGSGLGHPDIELTIVLEESHRTIPLLPSSRWKRPIARVVVLQDPLAELLPIIDSSRSENVVLASLSSVCVLDAAALLETAAGTGSRIVKLSVAKTPIETYAARRETIVSLLKSLLERRTDSKPLRESLFTDGLLPSMDLIEEVPGEVLFQNDLMEYHKNNLWVIGNCATDEYRRVLSRLPELADKSAESHIAEKACVRNSWLASGVEVEGEVEDSIIFANVHIRRNTRVFRSIIMNGNRIGTGGEIQNTLVLPFSVELSHAAPNIGDDCSIGSKSSIMKNADFPDQIRDGLTVVGMNAEIPAGLRIEAGACIGPGVPASLLRKMKLVKKGTSVFKQVDSEAEMREGVGKGRR